MTPVSLRFHHTRHIFKCGELKKVLQLAEEEAQCVREPAKSKGCTSAA